MVEACGLPPYVPLSWKMSHQGKGLRLRGHKDSSVRLAGIPGGAQDLPESAILDLTKDLG